MTTPANLLDNPAFEVLAVCGALLLLKVFSLSLHAALLRRRGGPDALERLEQVEHVRRRDVEAVALLFGVGLLYVLAGATATGGRVYFIVFTVARILGTWCELAGMPRAALPAQLAGALCLIGMAAAVALRAVG